MSGPEAGNGSTGEISLTICAHNFCRRGGAIEFILAGASAVSVGTANFHNPAVTLEVIDGIEAYMKKNGFNSVKEMVGIVK